MLGCVRTGQAVVPPRVSRAAANLMNHERGCGAPRFLSRFCCLLMIGSFHTSDARRLASAWWRVVTAEIGFAFGIETRTLCRRFERYCQTRLQPRVDRQERQSLSDTQHQSNDFSFAGDSLVVFVLSRAFFFPLNLYLVRHILVFRSFSQSRCDFSVVLMSCGAHVGKDIAWR